MHLILRALSYVIGIGLLVALVYLAPTQMITVLDWNLAAVKFICSMLPGEYGAMVEAASRLGLHIDSALLVAEGSWLASLALYPIRRAMRH